MLYAGFHGWLYCTPMGAKVPRVKLGMNKVTYPQVNQQHVLEYIFEIGWCVNNGQGATPISFGDILNWQEVTGIPLTSWEGRAIKQMSKEFCKFVHDKDAPNPLVEVSKDQATSLLAKFDNIMGKNNG